MNALLSISAVIDRILSVIARVGAWCGFLMIIVVLYDVTSRYLGVPKVFGLNSTKVQESEYWLHTILFTLVIGYAYTRQAHVRIDLLRDRFPTRLKYTVEIVGCVLFLMTYAALGAWFSYQYTHASFLEHEVSKSTIGLSHIWILKASLPLMFVLMGLAGISQLIKSVAGFVGKLPPQQVSETLGGAN